MLFTATSTPVCDPYVIQISALLNRFKINRYKNANVSSGFLTLHKLYQIRIASNLTIMEIPHYYWDYWNTDPVRNVSIN